MLFWHKDGPIEQWNRIESPEKNLHTYALLTREARLLSAERTLKKKNGSGKTGNPYAKI